MFGELKEHKRGEGPPELSPTGRQQQLVAAAKAWQLDAYDPKLWRRDFVRLMEVQTLPDLKRTGPKLQAFIWNKIPNDGFKRFQQIFVDFDDFIVPRHLSFDREGRLLFPGLPEGPLSVRPCLLNPKLLSDKLVLDLKLTDELNPAALPLERLRIKSQIRVLDTFKRIWDEARPLEGSNYRILVIQKSKQSDTASCVDAEAVADEVVGSLLYSRDPDLKSQDHLGAGRRLKAAFFSDPYRALRKNKHQTRAYYREIEAITTIENEVHFLAQRLNQDWQQKIKTDMKEQLRLAVIQVIDRSDEYLRRCVNSNKVTARQLLQQARDLKDSWGRDNPRAKLAKMQGALNQLRRRLDRIYKRGGYNASDEFMLQRVLRKQTGALVAFCAALQHEGNMGRISNPGLSLFKSNRFNRATWEREATGLLAAMDIRPERLAAVNVRPFRVFADKLRQKTAELKCCLATPTHMESEKRAAAGALLQSLRLLGRLQELNAGLEEMKIRIIEPSKDNLEVLVLWLRQSKEVLLADSDLEKLPPCGADLLSDLRQEWEGLSRRVSRYTRRNLRDMDLEKLRRLIYRHIENIGLMRRVKELP